ncbi:MAG: ChbG/HpnK family deacetylase, partial [Acidobacteriota bacterium]
IHLALVEERALTTGQLMPKNYTRFLLSLKPFDIERELRAQVERVLSTGLHITHLNGHQHLHMLPRIYAIAEELAREYGIGYVRVVNDVGGEGGLVRRLSIGALSALGRRVDSSRRTIGILEAGHLTASSIVSLLDHVEGLTELVTHPGISVDRYDWQYDWDAETAALCDASVRQAIVARGISLITPGSVGDPRSDA